MSALNPTPEEQAEVIAHIRARVTDGIRARMDVDKAADEVSRWLYGVPTDGWCHRFAKAVIDAAFQEKP